MTEKTKNALLALLAVLALALFVGMGGDDERELERHAQWQQELKEQGAWVMW